MKVKEKSCGCIIIENKKVLLVQQKKGRWGFPKGHVENNETEKETALREVKEETNNKIKKNKKINPKKSKIKTKKKYLFQQKKKKKKKIQKK